MEENKLDIYQIIGFLFLIAAVFYWFNVTIPNLEQNALEEKEIISKNQDNEINKTLDVVKQIIKKGIHNEI